MVADELGIWADALYRWKRELQLEPTEAFRGNGVLRAPDEKSVICPPELDTPLAKRSPARWRNWPVEWKRGGVPDIEFLAKLLRMDLPWKVVESIRDRQRGRVDVQIEWQGPGICPKCGHERPKHDHRERVWRDLDLCADHLYLHAMVPRISCPAHGAITVSVPWSVGRTESARSTADRIYTRPWTQSRSRRGTNALGDVACINGCLKDAQSGTDSVHKCQACRL